MKLIIKFPTRNRPEKFKEVFELYETKLSGMHNVLFVVTMDYDDPSMNNAKMIEWLNRRSVPTKYFYGYSKSKIEAVNANLEGLNADVLLLASDDMWPEYENYDELIDQKFKEFFKDYDGAIKFNDGLRQDDLMTLCVMGWPLYKKFGYIYNPEYTSLFCDTEQTLVLHAVKKIAFCKEILCTHRWSPKLDELHERNESMDMYKKDLAVFERRKAHNFNIDDLLKYEERLVGGGYACMSVEGKF